MRKPERKKRLNRRQNESNAGMDKMPGRKERSKQGHILQDRTMVTSVSVDTERQGLLSINLLQVLR